MKQWKFWPPPPVIIIVSFLLALAFSGSIPKRHVINDEAIELLVAQDLPFDQFYFFAPNYHGGNIVPVESFVPYINAFVGRIFGFHERHVHLVYALCYSLACYIFFLMLKRLYHNEGLAFWGALLLAGASYPLFYNRILTRNGIALLWTSLLLWLLSFLFDRKTDHMKLWILLFGLPLTLTFAMWTYSSFKFVTAAVYLSLAFWWLLWPKRVVLKRNTGLSVIGGALITFGLLLLLWWFSDTSIRYAIFRGGYVIGGERGFTLARYASHLFYSVVLPVFHKPGGDFLIEVTHTAYKRQMLAWFLAPLFVLGIWETLRTWKRGMQIQQLVVLIWLISVGFLAMGGPNLKHHFAVFPCVMFLTLHGAATLYTHRFWRFNRQKYRSAVGILLLLVVLGGEVWHLGWKIPKDSLLVLDAGLPYVVGSTALQLAEENVSKVYIVEGWGRDAVRYHSRHHPKIRYIGNHDSINREFLSDLQSDRSIGIVFEGDRLPKFLSADQRLAACFKQQGHRMQQWTVSTYVSAPPCEL